MSGGEPELLADWRPGCCPALPLDHHERGNHRDAKSPSPEGWWRCLIPSPPVLLLP